VPKVQGHSTRCPFVKKPSEKTFGNLYMIPEEAKTEVFWLAFKGLPRKEQQLIVQKLLQDQEFVEDLLDIAVIEPRRSKPSRPLEEYLAEQGR